MGSPIVRELLELKGFPSLNEMQEACEKRLGVSAGSSSIVVCAPTASGKTLLAELAVLKCLREGRMAVWMSPLRALASEKRAELSYFERLGFKVGISTSDYDRDGSPLGQFDLLFTTNERLDSLMRQGVGWLSRVGLIVCDEVHTVQDRRRGAVVDVVLTRAGFLESRPRIIALSATISNAREVAGWLGAELFESGWRPVPLAQFVAYPQHGSTTIVSQNGEARSVPGSDPVLGLIAECAEKGGSSLVFASTRKSAKGAALRAAKALPFDGGMQLNEEELGGEGEALYELLARGIGFHHAGLSFAHRKLVEDGFRSRKIKAIFSTTTLAAGLNLPARRVIIADTTRWDPEEGRVHIKVYEYQQMAGRAGRPGLDAYGESFLIARDASECAQLLKRYVHGTCEPAHSTLLDVHTYPPQVLSLICSRLAKSAAELEEFTAKTLGGRQFRAETIREISGEHIRFMLANGLLAQSSDGTLRPTPLGSLSSRLYIHPETTVGLLRRGGREASLSLAERLYLVASSVELQDMPPHSVRQGEVQKLIEEADALGIALGTARETEPHAQLKAFKRSLVMMDWCEGVPESHIAQRHYIEAGDVTRIVETAQWITHAANALSRTFGGQIKGAPDEWGDGEARMENGLPPRAQPLAALPHVGRKRAMAILAYMDANRPGWSVEDVAALSREELLGIEGIGKKISGEIKGTRGNEPAAETHGAGAAGKGGAGEIGKVEAGAGTAPGEGERIERVKLVSRLKMLRHRLSKKAGLPDYFILPNHALEQMAGEKTETIEQLSKVKGVGPKKAAKYGEAFLRAIRGPAAARSRGGKGKEIAALTESEERLFEKLREIRLRIAQAENGPAFHIFHDSMLRRFAKEKPKSIEEMGGLWMIGQKRAEKYGKEFLGAILEYLAAGA